jgi:uncharacterized surface protein with fasciclin (FAS1) repeats
MRRMMKMGSCADPVAPPSAAKAPADVIDTALAAGSFNKLLSAIMASGLGETLKGSGPFTMFAPADAGFEHLPAETLASMLKPENKSRLRSLLTYHVVPGRLTAAELTNIRTLTAFNGQELSVRVDVSGVAGSELRGTRRVGPPASPRPISSARTSSSTRFGRVLTPAS